MSVEIGNDYKACNCWSHYEETGVQRGTLSAKDVDFHPFNVNINNFYYLKSAFSSQQSILSYEQHQEQLKLCSFVFMVSFLRVLLGRPCYKVWYEV